MVQPIPKNKQMELPSVTKKKVDLWKEVDDLYNSSYALLSQAVAFVQVIVKNNYVQLEHVDPVTLTNMVSNLDRDVRVKRNELNAIYNDLTSKKNNDKLASEDVFMIRIQLTNDIEQWTQSYMSIIVSAANDIRDYITKGNNTDDIEVPTITK